jgi:hypothetical protein
LIIRPSMRPAAVRLSFKSWKDCVTPLPAAADADWRTSGAPMLLPPEPAGAEGKAWEGWRAPDTGGNSGRPVAGSDWTGAGRAPAAGIRSAGDADAAPAGAAGVAAGRSAGTDAGDSRAIPGLWAAAGRARQKSPANSDPASWQARRWSSPRRLLEGLRRMVSPATETRYPAGLTLSPHRAPDRR